MQEYEFLCKNILSVVLLRHFTYVGAIEISKTDLISRRYQIMIGNILKN